MKRWLWNKILWLVDPFLDKSSEQFLRGYYKSLPREEKMKIWKFSGRQYRIFKTKSFGEHHKDMIKRHYFKRIPFNDRK